MADGYSGQEHSLPIMPLYKDVIEFVARTKTFYTPTILVAYGAPWTENFYFETENMVNDTKLRKLVPWELLDTMIRRRTQWFLPEEYGHTSIAKGVADVVHAGGRADSAAMASCRDSARTGKRGISQSGGLTPHETLRVVTQFSAEAIGLQQDVGSLEVGQAGGSHRARQESAREHPQYEFDPLRDEERRDLRRRHAEHDLAGTEDAEAVLGRLWSG